MLAINCINTIRNKYFSLLTNFEHVNIIMRIISFTKKGEYRATLFHYLQPEIVICSHQIFFISQTIY